MTKARKLKAGAASMTTAELRDFRRRQRDRQEMHALAQRLAKALGVPESKVTGYSSGACVVRRGVLLGPDVAERLAGTEVGK